MKNSDQGHLFQMPQYRGSNGVWTADFTQAALSCDQRSWDPAALLSFISLGYVCGDKTLVKEVSRQPWLSSFHEGDVQLNDVPKHGFKKQTGGEIADEMIRLLENEAERACRGKNNVFVLTSGGLDSRIVAGVVKRLKDQNRINAQIHSVTWGRTGCRDVAIGKVVANSLDFNWTHLELGSEHLYENISSVADDLGALVSPMHLHRMNWFRSLSETDVVLAGSYGDSIGRAEFSGRTVLDLIPFRFSNTFNLLNPDVVTTGLREIQAEMKRYRERFSDRPEYAVRECEQQCHYMRGMIAQTMSVIADKASVYQMFTDPELFGYVWSVHPSFRTNKPYEMILKKLGNGLDSLPWARTNRTLSGSAGVKIASTLKGHHDYSRWMVSYLDQVDIESHAGWLEETGIFNPGSIVKMANQLRNSASFGILQTSVGLLSWTFSLRNLAERITPVLPKLDSSNTLNPELSASTSAVRRYLSEVTAVRNTARKTRTWLSRRKAIREFPPE